MSEYKTASVEEKLAFKNLQVSFLISKDLARDAIEKTKQAEQAMSQFIFALAEKLGVDRNTSVFNADTLSFEDIPNK